MSNNERYTEGKEQGSWGRVNTMKGNSNNRIAQIGTQEIESPRLVYLRRTASPSNKTTVAGVSMETSERQTEDERITIYFFATILLIASTIIFVIRHEKRNVTRNFWTEILNGEAKSCKLVTMKYFTLRKTPFQDTQLQEAHPSEFSFTAKERGFH